MMRFFFQINNLRPEILFYKFTETLIKRVNFRELRILPNSRTGKISIILTEKRFSLKQSVEARWREINIFSFWFLRIILK